MHLRIRYKLMGHHVHCRVFCGEVADQAHGLAGDLCFRRDEWEALKMLALEGCGPHARNQVQLVDENDVPPVEATT